MAGNMTFAGNSELNTWGLLAPKPLGVFRYRLLSLKTLRFLHFY